MLQLPFAESDLSIQIPCNFSDYVACLLYTSDAADDLLCVDLGGRRIIKKKNTSNQIVLPRHL